MVKSPGDFSVDFFASFFVVCQTIDATAKNYTVFWLAMMFQYDEIGYYRNQNERVCLIIIDLKTSTLDKICVVDMQNAYLDLLWIQQSNSFIA